MPVVVAIVFVLASYLFFGSAGRFRDPRLYHMEDSNYATLAEGFAHGHLYMARVPDPKLIALPNPWDNEARIRHGVFYPWDVSYLNDHYYLYYSPLPALLFYLPFQIVRGAYPSDALAAMFFCAWAFIAAVVFTRRALALSDRRALIPFSLWILLIGLGNVVPFVLNTVNTYEVSIAAGTAMTSMWALAMLAFAKSPTFGRMVWMSLWLALSIAARPNLGVLLLVSAAVVINARRSIAKTAIAFIAPLAIVASAMIAYNVARFHEPFEFGIKYQLTSVSMADRRICSLCNVPEAMRFANNAMHYLFFPPSTRSHFPFVNLEHANLDPEVSWPTENNLTEQVVGIGPLIPLTFAGVLFAILFLAGLGREHRDTGTRVSMQVMAGGWLTLLGLCTCWWMVARYSLDFLFLMVPASVVCIEAGLAHLRDAGIRIQPLRICVVILAIYSIVLGFMLGFVGPGDAFERNNPTTFRRIAGWLS